MLPRGLLKEYFQILSMVLRAFDITAIVVSGLIAHFYRFGHWHLSREYELALLIASILTTFVFPFFHIYLSVRAQSFWKHISQLVQAVFAVFLFLAGIAFLTKTGTDFSRIWFVMWAVCSFLLFILFRCSLLIVLRVMRSHGLNERRIIIIGAGELAVRLLETVQQSIWTGFRVTTIFDDTAQAISSLRGVPVFPMPENISTYLASIQESADEIWIALPLHAEVRVKKILHNLRHDTITTRLILDVLGMNLLNHSITALAGFPTLTLNASPMVGVNRLTKAIEDRVLALLILVLISPLFLIIILGIKYSSKGPIFFKQLRHGWDGRIIKIYKFRTMKEHADANGEVKQATLFDERVTPFGRFLRKTSLDELPQFINILQGRMSIVGPRPHAVLHNEFYKDSIKAYMQRHKVKPGITGWAQVNGWRGETETLNKMEKRVEYDLYYIENWSLIFDLKIIFLTFFRGLIHKNAY